MSIQSEIDRIKNKINIAYLVIKSKGGTIPEEETVSGLRKAILSIPERIKLEPYARKVNTVYGSVSPGNSGYPDIGADGYLVGFAKTSPFFGILLDTSDGMLVLTHFSELEENIFTEVYRSNNGSLWLAKQTGNNNDMSIYYKKSGSLSFSKFRTWSVLSTV